MDLNFKGNWVGNIYQRFETMCQDVDDFVSKDTVKHVQIVGASVRKLYSGVVADVIPPSVDPVKHAAQVLPREDLNFPDNRNLVEQCLDNKPTDEPIIYDQGRSSQGEELSWSWSSDSDASVYKNEEGGTKNNIETVVAVDENIMEEGAEIMYKASLHSVPADGNPNNDTSTRKSELDEVEGDTNISSLARKSQLDASVVHCDQKIESSRNSPESHSLSDFQDTNCPKETEMICCDSSTDMMGCLSKFPSALQFSASFHGLAFDDKEVDVSSSSTLSLEFEDVHTTIRSDEAFSAAEHSGIKHEQYCGFVPFEDSMSYLDTGIEDSSTIDVADLSLETIDLSDRVKLDESWGFISEDNPVNAAYSFRARGHRSYKKIIQDAFTSRKRITKEYKQLGILYGDIDIDSSSHLQQYALASNNTIPFKSKEAKDSCDSEWELL